MCFKKVEMVFGMDHGHKEVVLQILIGSEDQAALGRCYTVVALG